MGLSKVQKLAKLKRSVVYFCFLNGRADTTYEKIDHLFNWEGVVDQYHQDVSSSR